MKMMARQFPRGTYLYCPNGSHMAMYDDQVTYFDGVLNFIRNVEQGATASGRTPADAVG
jgi:proline iminopeptidase